MPNKHYVILVPGLNDRVKLMQLVTFGWKQNNVTLLISAAPWEDGSSYEKKLEMLVDKVDALSKKGRVSLVGVSAGGSLVVNAFAKRKTKVHRVVNICGRLRVGGLPTLQWAAHGRQSFIDSVTQAEKVLKTLSPSEKEKIMTIRPIWDGIVPLSAISISGANNLTIPLVLHMMGTGGTPILYKKKILNFITRGSMH